MSGLFKVKKPNSQVPPPPPRIGDAAAEGAAVEQRYRIKRTYDTTDTMLTGLGGPGARSAPRQPSRTMLG